MDVSVIIVNYNTCDMTAACIESIYKNTVGVSFEVILVDNASVDNSRKKFSEDSRIIYIYETINHGFGIANNIGVQRATGKYLFFLNSDTLLLNNAIYEFWRFCESLNEDVVAGSYLLDQKLVRTHSYSIFLTPKTELRNMLCPFRKYSCEDLNSSPAVKEVDYITGADLFIKKSIFLDHCGFFKGFFMYFEETDIQCRISKSGIKRLVILGPKIMHLEGGSFNRNNRRFVLTPKKIMIQESKLLYFKRNFFGGWYILYRLILPIYVMPFFITNSPINLKKKLLKIVMS